MVKSSGLIEMNQEGDIDLCKGCKDPSWCKKEIQLDACSCMELQKLYCKVKQAFIMLNGTRLFDPDWNKKYHVFSDAHNALMNTLERMFGGDDEWE